MKVRYSPRLVIGVLAFGGVVALIGVAFVLLGQPAGGLPVLVAGVVGVWSAFCMRRHRTYS